MENDLQAYIEELEQRLEQSEAKRRALCHILLLNEEDHVAEPAAESDSPHDTPLVSPKVRHVDPRGSIEEAVARDAALEAHHDREAQALARCMAAKKRAKEGARRRWRVLLGKGVATNGMRATPHLPRDHQQLEAEKAACRSQSTALAVSAALKLQEELAALDTKWGAFVAQWDKKGADSNKEVSKLHTQLHHATQGLADARAEAAKHREAAAKATDELNSLKWSQEAMQKKWEEAVLHTEALQEEVEVLKLRCTRLAHQADEARKEGEGVSRDELDALREEKAVLEATKSEAEGAVLRLQERLSEADREREVLRGEVAALERDAAVRSAQMEGMENQLEMLKAVASEESSLKSARSQAEDEARIYRKAALDTQAALDEAREQCHLLHTEKAHLDQALREAEGRVANLERDLESKGALAAELASCKLKAEEQAEALITLRVKYSHATEELELLSGAREKLADVQEQLAEARASLTAQRQVADKHTEMLRETETALKAARSEVDHLRDELASAARQLQGMERVSAERDDLKAQVEEWKKKEKAFDELQLDCAQLQREAASYREESERQRAAVMELQSAIADTKEQLAATKEMKKVAEAGCAEHRDKLERLQAEHMATVQELASAKTKLAVLGEEESGKGCVLKERCEMLEAKVEGLVKAGARLEIEKEVATQKAAEAAESLSRALAEVQELKQRDDGRRLDIEELEKRLRDLSDEREIADLRMEKLEMELGQAQRELAEAVLEGKSVRAKLDEAVEEASELKTRVGEWEQEADEIDKLLDEIENWMRAIEDAAFEKKMDATECKDDTFGSILEGSSKDLSRWLAYLEDRRTDEVFGLKRATHLPINLLIHIVTLRLSLNTYAEALMKSSAQAGPSTPSVSTPLSTPRRSTSGRTSISHFISTLKGR